METVAANLIGVAERFVPRLLTQACRDPNAPFFGCFDRNWWHYKIRDFPSAILQQGGYAAHLAGQMDEFAKISTGLEALASGSVRFWAERAIQHGAFEEYYPYEQGYPPLAFSTLSAAKLCLSGTADPQAAMPALRVAASQLLGRFEPQAANQQVAGLAALACLRVISSALVPDQSFDSIARRTLALQHGEGWYMEYDGPDLGYLTVTIDCLWDLCDVTGDQRFFESAARAFAYVEWFVASPFRGAGMHNARNTDYLVPYGLARFAGLGGDWEKRAGSLLEALYRDTSSPDHFFSAVDDRYVSHYIGHSVIRAILELRGGGASPVSRQTVPSAPVSLPVIADSYLPGSGHWTGGASLLVAGKKGGILTAARSDGGSVADFGWIVRRAGKDFVSHWWSQDWAVDAQETRISIHGKLYPHIEHLSTPPKHMALRLMSFFLGSRLIGWLKSILIFKAGGQQLSFSRTVTHENDGLIRVEDKIVGILTSDELVRAPRASKRHVASADSYHQEDFLLAQDCERKEAFERSGSTVRITTAYQLEV